MNSMVFEKYFYIEKIQKNQHSPIRFGTRNIKKKLYNKNER